MLICPRIPSFQQFNLRVFNGLHSRNLSPGISNLIGSSFPLDRYQPLSRSQQLGCQFRHVWRPKALSQQNNHGFKFGKTSPTGSPINGNNFCRSPKKVPIIIPQCESCEGFQKKNNPSDPFTKNQNFAMGASHPSTWFWLSNVPMTCGPKVFASFSELSNELLKEKVFPYSGVASTVSLDLSLGNKTISSSTLSETRYLPSASNVDKASNSTMAYHQVDPTPFLPQGFITEHVQHREIMVLAVTRI